MIPVVLKYVQHSYLATFDPKTFKYQILDTGILIKQDTLAHCINKYWPDQVTMVTVVQSIETHNKAAKDGILYVTQT